MMNAKATNELKISPIVTYNRAYLSLNSSVTQAIVNFGLPWVATRGANRDSMKGTGMHYLHKWFFKNIISRCLA